MNAFGYEHELARAYYKLLTALDWRDDVLITGLREGLNKFLSNAYLCCFRGVQKYHKTHFVSLRALDRLQRKDYKGLVFEHLVPKRHHLQKLCEERAAEGSLTIGYIEDLLKSYWRLATVTKEEDASLRKYTMPDDWDGKAVFARYQAVGIELIENPFFSTTKRKEEMKDSS